jgi:hypothetical protein
MGLVVNCIHSMMIEVVQILTGCTYLWQPTDMGHQQIHQNSAAQKEGRMGHK